MLVLDFINVGNGDATLVRHMEGNQLLFSMLVDCGHDALERPSEDSQRIFAGDFLRQEGITHLDLLVLTHYHRDHIGGLGRVLEQVTVGEAIGTYYPPLEHPPLNPEADDGLVKGARNVVRWLEVYDQGWRSGRHKVDKTTLLDGSKTVTHTPTEGLSITVLPSEQGFYPRQSQVFDQVFAGVRDRTALLQWAKSMNPSSLRVRISYHGKDVVIGGDMYGVLWDADTTAPCHILKVPHHGSIVSVTRKMLSQLQPEICVISVISNRHDEKPHSFAVSLMAEFAQEIHCTDAVDLPGQIEPIYHQSVHFELI